MTLPLDQYTIKELRDGGHLVLVWQPDEMVGLDGDAVRELTNTLTEVASSTIERFQSGE